MGKKIIIVGPPGAGKTTLRKTFFEGESSTHLLEYSLDPTHGQESLLLKLKEDIGIFDLAGQENQRWFESDEKIIFTNSKVILVVIDANTPTNVILEFIMKILEIRSNLTPTSIIYVLIHKIDLIDHKKLFEIKSEINHALMKEKLINVLFTSLKKEHFSHTFSYFIEIINICLQDDLSSEKFDFIQLNETIKLLDIIDKELVASKQDLQIRLNITEKNLNHIIDSLIQKGQILFSPVKDQKILTLTKKGKNNFNKIINNFSLKNILQFKDEAKVLEPSKKEKIPPFVGYFIANKDGLTLITIELFDGALLKFLKNKTEAPTEEDQFNVNLIPMFISALEKFSKEINIQNLSGFNLMGTNLKMQIFGFDNYTVTFFCNPNIYIKLIEYEIKNYFTNLFESNKEEFKESIRYGSLDNIDELNQLGRKWLEELNKSYEHSIIDLELFDIESAKNLYNGLEDFQEITNLEFSIILEKIKKLKLNLMKAIVAEDFEEVKVLAKIFQELKIKCASKIS